MTVEHELVDGGDGRDPFVGEADVAGLYPVDVAAAASRVSMTDGGSGQWRADD